jgi:hypothetical protein
MNVTLWLKTSGAEGVTKIGPYKLDQKEAERLKNDFMAYAADPAKAPSAGFYPAGAGAEATFVVIRYADLLAIG